jgi:hypothetical protein
VLCASLFNKGARWPVLIQFGFNIFDSFGIKATMVVESVPCRTNRSLRHSAVLLEAGVMAASSSSSGLAPKAPEGLGGYYQARLDELESAIREKSLDLRRLEAQRNELNTRGTSCVVFAPTAQPRGFHSLSAVRLLREELFKLQEPASSIGEVVKQMGKEKCLVKVRA